MAEVEKMKMFNEARKKIESSADLAFYDFSLKSNNIAKNWEDFLDCDMDFAEGYLSFLLQAYYDATLAAFNLRLAQARKQGLGEKISPNIKTGIKIKGMKEGEFDQIAGKAKQAFEAYDKQNVDREQRIIVLCVNDEDARKNQKGSVMAMTLIEASRGFSHLRNPITLSKDTHKLFYGTK